MKTLKDCAFPLPMNALGGCTQSFESFDGALLDVVRACMNLLCGACCSDFHFMLCIPAAEVLGSAAELSADRGQHAQVAGAGGGRHP